ncbi:MAG: UDP-N-acetylglucosamine 2-epimerase (non-hydrolyzing) [Synergistaceae bacterium]|nr:UDP-N-acetylglucosamine 2-epimerase (non-hydrolyzing) [Synergistaceae bacterium]
MQIAKKKHEAEMKVDVVIGTRPEAIKMAPVILELRARGGFSVRVIATGQHAEMLNQALNYFSLTADVNLGIMRREQTLDYIASAVLQGVGGTLDADRPDVVLVHGDTTTTLSAAMAAFYRRIPVGHVEAGLRSHDMSSPFPEEMNRVLTDRIASLWFAPTELARRNLVSEGVPADEIRVTGNTVVDALHRTIKCVSAPKESCMSQLLHGVPFILLTAHRRESWGVPLERICEALLEILRQHGAYRALVPMHKNPVVRDTISRILGKAPGVILCDPLDYPDFVWAINSCKLILSDSGGVQEEATALRKPVLILRDVTERPEAIEHGSGVLVGADKSLIMAEADRLLSDPAAYAEIVARCDGNPFGDGTASAKIADALSGVHKLAI